MISRTHRRHGSLGQSFSTCLLIVVLFFGGIGMYYFKVFQWRHLEDPLYDLLVVEKDDSAELAFFRRKTVPDFVDPAMQQLTKLKKVRKASKKATAPPEGYEQTLKEINNRLLEVMNGAKLRQIPKQYKKRYDDVLVGISEIYKSNVAFQDAIGSDIPADKERLLKQSISSSKSAERKLKTARDFFLN